MCCEETCTQVRPRGVVHLALCFIETIVFSRRLTMLGLDAELKALQDALIENPEAGATEAGTGGLRKIRVPDPQRGKGKRSGARVHYLYLAAHDVIYLIFVYGKDDQEKLTAEQKKLLKTVAEAIRSEWN